jgi:hypothetical protein
MFESHKDIIDAWPSLGAFAGDAGVSSNTAKQMRTRNSIHSDHWTRIVAGAERRSIAGVTHEVLAATKPPRRGSPAFSETAEKQSHAA